MDEAFAVFLDVFGTPVGRQEVPVSSLEHYRGKLPDLLLNYWVEHGWCGYGNGILWLVNPQEYDGVVASWTEGAEIEVRDAYHVVARSAFGDLYLWGEKTGPSVKIVSIFSRYDIQDFDIASGEMDKEVENFLLSKEVEYCDLENMFERAKKKLGVLNHDEMYGFVPALMLGGSPTLDHLEKVKAVEHLIFLSQLAELEPYNFSDT